MKLPPNCLKVGIASTGNRSFVLDGKGEGVPGVRSVQIVTEAGEETMVVLRIPMWCVDVKFLPDGGSG